MKNLQGFYKDKNVLVTGGAGFIGSNICKELVNLGANVTIIDNFSTGNLYNLKNILSKINIICGDITNSFSCNKITKNKDIIFHLAAFVSVADSIKNPNLCYKINIGGTKNLLNACKKNKVSKFIFSSSASVYGNRKDKCSEKDKPNPQSPYAKSKLEGEKLCKKYYKELGIQTACLRYFNVYGNNQNPDGEYAAVVAKFKYNLQNKIPITIFGDGKQTRDFIHVSKVAYANLKIAIEKNLSGQIINIATGKSINLLELIKDLEKEINIKNVGLTFEPQRPGDILNSSADCRKYQKLIKI
ncbi:NAD-dependent epimerase/dehydratase family protein [Candidatus Dependentiae bacterium]|nr:NAD-dependent epimerase/dehydratase family protein [Candidatus Dependentiae bacterium]